jgi:lipopolysaccharide/colanic/teichoic acid biosynthesis glycosyltransferase
VRLPVAKRAEDVVLSLLLLVLLSPVFVGVLLVLAVDMLLVPADRGPFLYRERRLGRGREFDLLKFRTLRADVLRQGRGYAASLEADPHNLTRAGRLLKRWYLDELPQLLDIVTGRMSLVGVRPWPVTLLDAGTVAGQEYRRTAVVGWTGPAQLTKGTPVDSTQLDLMYLNAVETWSGARLVRYDVAILLRTVRVLLRGEGLQN